VWPRHPSATLLRDTARKTVIRNGQMNIQNARRIAEIMLEAAVAAGGDAKAPMESVILQNEIAHGELQLNEPVLIQLTNSEKTQNSDKWRTYREQNASFAKHRGQTHSLILRQRSQLLEDKMKQDADWTVVFDCGVSVSYNLLTLCQLIRKTVLAQTEDQHPFATAVCDQELWFCSFCQENMSNPQWCQHFNTQTNPSGNKNRHMKNLFRHMTQTSQ
jgi:hypothetical protein